MRFIGILVCTVIAFVLCTGFKVQEALAHASGMGTGMVSILLVVFIAFLLHKVSA